MKGEFIDEMLMKKVTCVQFQKTCGIKEKVLALAPDKFGCTALPALPLCVV